MREPLLSEERRGLAHMYINEYNRVLRRENGMNGDVQTVAAQVYA